MKKNILIYSVLAVLSLGGRAFAMEAPAGVKMLIASINEQDEDAARSLLRQNPRLAGMKEEEQGTTPLIAALNAKEYGLVDTLLVDYNVDH